MKKIVFFLNILTLTCYAQYKGHGGDSLSAAVIKKFAPKSVDPDLRAKIQKSMDLHKSSSGILDEKNENLYFNWSVTGVSQVWKLNAPMSFPQQMTSGEDATSLLDVSYDSKFIVLSRDNKGDEYPGIYIQSSKGGELKEIYRKSKVRADYAFMSPDSRFIYFKANDTQPEDDNLYRHDLKNSKTEILYAGKGNWEVSDRDHENSKLLLTKMKGSAAFELYLFDEKSKALTPLFGQDEEIEYDAQFGKDYKELFVLTNKWDDLRRIYKWQGIDKNGKFTPFSPASKATVENFSVLPKEERILVNWNKDGFMSAEAYEMKSGKKLLTLEVKDAQHLSFSSTTHNERYTNLLIGYHNRPNPMSVYDWKKKKTVEWMAPSTPEMDTSSFTRASLEYYDAEDGTKIPMFIYRGNNCKTNNCPVIVNFHGGPEAQSTPGFDPLLERYLEAGFIVVEPNVRGSDGYGKKWLDADNGPKRLQVITDIRDCARFIKKNWKHNGKAPKVGVEGGSYGGYSTLMAMTYFAGEYDAGASSVGMSSLISFLQNTAPYRRVLRESEYGYLNKDMKALRELSPITHINKAKGPLLILQGATDPRVPPGESLQIYNAWARKNLPVDLILFEDEGHGIRKRNNRVTAVATTLAFFKKHLK